ncbi:hypothetical protein GBA52_014956, partial [Prunus armeniaca]
MSLATKPIEFVPLPPQQPFPTNPDANRLWTPLEITTKAVGFGKNSRPSIFVLRSPNPATK